VKHQTLDQLHVVADVQAEATYLVATRGERLERWRSFWSKTPIGVSRRLRAPNTNPPRYAKECVPAAHPSRLLSRIRFFARKA